MNYNRGYYDIFVQTCAKYPSAVAVRLYENGNYKNYTYSELYGVCEYLSQNIQQVTSKKGIIGVVSERNVVIPCVIAAIHKCTSTFMFLEPSSDVEQLMKNLKFNVVITVNNTCHSDQVNLFCKSPDKTITVFNLEINIYNVGSNNTTHDSKHVQEHSFIAMTSGSTGKPKHIQVPVQCIQPNIDDLTKIFEIKSSDVIFFSTPLTFDPSMIEILLACMNGASLLIAPEKVNALFPTCQENSVTFWQTTPSRFFQYSNADLKTKILSSNSTLKILALGGEPLNGISRLQGLKDRDNQTRIFTLYGVTEMSCWASVAELDFNKMLTDRELPLGKCLSETQMVIEPNHNDKNMGNIVLVSKTRKCIILNNPGISEDESSLKFIQTGDIGEIKNGVIYYKGRRDDVIKRFGHKINLQYIESSIMQCPGVKCCSCIWLPKPMLLVVYFSSETLTSNELSDFLKSKLDDKHWPNKVIRVENLPTNSHGKLSKQLLSQMFANVVTPTIENLKIILLKELQIVLNKNFIYDEIKNHNFMSLGGTSFLAITMCNELSLAYPQFGKFILPYLLTHNTTIDEIIKLALKELRLDEKLPQKKLKRNKSSKAASDILSSFKSLKRAPELRNPVNFIVSWTYNTGKCVDASPTLFQDGLNLYVTIGSHSGIIVVVDAITGFTQGVLKVKSRVQASVVCTTYNKPPLVTICGIVGTYNGTIVCFTLIQCIEVWKINIRSMIKSKGVCCKEELYIASYDGKVRCIDILTGIIKDIIDVGDQPISADLVLAKNEFILLGNLAGVCACIHIGTKSIAWRTTLNSPVFAKPVLYDSDKFVVFAEVTGEIHCRTVEKGIKIWKYQCVKGNIFSSIHIKQVAKLKWQMIFGCHDNNVYSINITNFQPTFHWKSELTSPVYGTPCSLTDKLILAVSNNGKLCILDIDSGNVISEYNLPNESFSTPVVFNDHIFIGCRNDNIYAIKYLINF